MKRLVVLVLVSALLAASCLVAFQITSANVRTPLKSGTNWSWPTTVVDSAVNSADSVQGLWRCTPASKNATRGNGVIMNVKWNSSLLTLAYVAPEHLGSVSTPFTNDPQSQVASLTVGSNLYSGVDATATPRGGWINSICFVRFEGSKTPVALVSENSGGSGCCAVFGVLTPLGSQGLWMIPNKMQLGEGGLFDSRGVAIIVSFRTSFEDPWTDSADYASPLVALTYRNNGFDVVTARYRVLISRDAADLLSEGTMATTIGHDPRGFLAAYMVDECELGRADAGWAALDRLNQLGELNPGIDGGPKGAAYIKNLVLVLHSQDYCTAGH